MRLSVSKLSHHFPQQRVLQDLSFWIQTGEIVSLIGTSGSGKTTLLRLIAGLIPVQEGEIHLNPPYHAIAYVTQHDLLLPWRTAYDNLCLLNELGSADGSDPISDTRIRRMFQDIGLCGCEGKYPHELSGGMRKRLTLARALLSDRPLLLLDEPFDSLDLPLRLQMYSLLKRVCRETQKSVLLVTHDFRDALTLSDRILALSEGMIAKEWQLDEAQLNTATLEKDMLCALSQQH